MKNYVCVCKQPVFFNNSLCIACGRAVGFDPLSREMHALDAAEDGLVQEALVEVQHRRFFLRRPAPVRPPVKFRFCANLHACGCNWLVPAESEEGALCIACETTRVIPDLSLPGNAERWTKLETAKRRLLYTFLDLNLWGPDAAIQPTVPLLFEFLQSLPGQPAVLTGHANGVITLNVEEADDDFREKTRLEMQEPYRSVLGHFRHESGHYFWEVLIQNSPWIAEYRQLFGDESADYAAALQRHYSEGPAPGWEQLHISSYAASHPWEDWAETWAHWLHMSDTLETAESYQCRSNAAQPQVSPAILSAGGQEPSAEMKAFCEQMGLWVGLTTLVNELTRSMGQPDAYPFVCSGEVLKKLFFIERVLSAVQNCDVNE